MPTDNELMKRFLECSRDAFNELMGRYSKRLLNYLSFRFGKQCGLPLETCEDIVQDAFLRVYRIKLTGRSRFDPARAAFSTWLYTIAIRLAYNKCGQPPGSDIDPDTLPSAGGLDAGSDVDLRDCLGRLRPQDYDLVMRRFYEGYTYAELEEEFGVNANALRQRMHHILRQLRACMAA